MNDDIFELDDVIVFELPSFTDLEAFRERFRPRWEGWSDADEFTSLFVVRLRSNADLAPVLREAQELLVELGLDGAAFFLDGRAYVLVAAASATVAVGSTASGE